MSVHDSRHPQFGVVLGTWSLPLACEFGSVVTRRLAHTLCRLAWLAGYTLVGTLVLTAVSTVNRVQ